jgi:RNA polymerase sigma-70 factor (ECF subfamily)
VTGGPLESTAVLLRRAQGGDTAARDALLRRHLPLLRRWAHGRLPRGARDLAETDDLVQSALLRALDHLEAFEPRHEGAFFAYLRQILINGIRDEVRRAARRPGRVELPDSLAAPGPSLLEETLGSAALATYERALAALPEEQQQAVILRIELGLSHQEIAEALGKPTANAARMTVSRALVRLAEAMDEWR